MRELAQVLEVDSTDVTETRPTQQGTENSLIEQLNADEFEDMAYHATFDPVAAAQASKEERAAAEAEGVPIENADDNQQTPR
ncbi:unnamed protein product [Heligmosomoides polygyrus]|uniref:DNA-binding protein n=1 Tax=Heligmosomoides polygyrus TaxID=6339 RepID=A0A183FCV7_HELPZ|nr:unnamed protein product [Heligmosomoides polygyrus]